MNILIFLSGCARENRIEWKCRLQGNYKNIMRQARRKGSKPKCYNVSRTRCIPRLPKYNTQENYKRQQNLVFEKTALKKKKKSVWISNVSVGNLTTATALFLSNSLDKSFWIIFLHTRSIPLIKRFHTVTIYIILRCVGIVYIRTQLYVHVKKGIV